MKQHHHILFAIVLALACGFTWAKEAKRPAEAPATTASSTGQSKKSTKAKAAKETKAEPVKPALVSPDTLYTAWQADEKVDLRGEKVTWSLVVSGVHTEARSKKTVLYLRAPGGVGVLAPIGEGQKELLAKVTAGKAITIKGVVEDYRLQPWGKKRRRKRDTSTLRQVRYFNDAYKFNVAIKDAAITEIKEGVVNIFGKTIPADHVVYVFTTRGALLNKMDIIRSEIQRSVEGLSEKQRFQIITFKETPTYLSKTPLLVGEANKRKADVFLSKVRSGGTANKGLAATLARLRRPAGRKPVVVIVSMGRAEDPKAVLRIARRCRVPIHTFHVGYKSLDKEHQKKTTKLMKELAKRSKGEYTALDWPFCLD